MIARELLLQKLRRLLADGELPLSSCGAALLREIQPLLDASVIAKTRSGAGRRLTVSDRAALKEFIDNLFPGLEGGTDAFSRVSGVARFRNSKSYSSDTPEIICCRVWSETALLSDGIPSGAAAATKLHGAFAFVPGQNHSLHNLWALVENPAVFHALERVKIPVAAAIYGRGHLSRAVLDWMGQCSSPDFSLLHMPDYDPIGLCEFERLRRCLGERVQLYMPANLARLFERFANATLLHKPRAQALLASLRRSSVPEVRRVTALIDAHNAGLEQECLIAEIPQH